MKVTVNMEVTLNGEKIGEVEDMNIDWIADREPPYWCPKCGQAVKGTFYGVEPDVKIVCARCGSPDIGPKEDMEFNPSRR